MLTLGRDLCGEWPAAAARGWLAGNGLGGYACGTVAGANTSRYHSFLTASLAPPVDRKVLIAKVDVTVEYRGVAYPLAANEFADGTVAPRGFEQLESFTVLDGVPVWRYALADALLEQRIFMARGANVSYLQLEVLRASAPLRVMLKPLVACRDHHAHARGLRPFSAAPTPAGCALFEGDAAPFCNLALDQGTFEPGTTWYWNFLHREEAARGMDAFEDLWGPGTFAATLLPGGAALCFSASAERGPRPGGAAVLEAKVARARQFAAAVPARAPGWVRSLAMAAEPFIVQRGPTAGDQTSLIAGYPWFTDWGRDTMISLPGFIALGRYDECANILRTFARYVDRGMIPNRFPDAGAAPEYNTADATLWYFQAVSEQLEARRDPALMRELYPTLSAIIHAHVAGTRYGIGVDPGDGLLRAGVPGVALTWMDAKHEDRVFTPRIGKPVEINALWLNALHVAARLAGRVRAAADKARFESLLSQGVESFGRRFWNDAEQCLYDVIDVDGGDGCDAAIRPNQLFAVSLPLALLTPERMRGVVDACARHLLTSYGLRTLSPEAAGYIGRYQGSLPARDAAYHQGTVWAWLLGPFARAHYRVYRDARAALRHLEPFEQHLGAACLGSVSEIFDGDAPHAARGCFAQAWSVAEPLRAWLMLAS